MKKAIFEPFESATLEHKNGSIEVSGVLNSDTVMTILSPGYELIKKLSKPVFDFSAVTYADSAALALLLAWSRFAKQLHKKVSYTHIPIAMIEIAQACRLSKILSFPTHKKIN